MLMWLRLISAWMAASWLLEQVVLHRDWGRHVPTLSISNVHVTFEGMNILAIWVILSICVLDD